jgi:sugar (pentulose or hexulose) kinase
MYRSVMEGIAMTMWGNLKAMCEARGFDIRRVIVSGGGSSGDLVMRIVADVSGRPSVRTEVNGAVALGSAICAAVCSGVYPGFDEAMAAMVRVKDVFEPDPRTHDFYRKLIDEVYSKLTKYTDEPLKLAHTLFDPKPGIQGGSGENGPGAGG